MNKKKKKSQPEFFGDFSNNLLNSDLKLMKARSKKKYYVKRKEGG